MVMDYPKLAQKYITDHNTPLIKTDQFGLKLFTSSLTEAQTQHKEKCLESIKSVLEYDRVERRQARAVAEWLPEENVAKVTKITGSLNNFGYQNKKGKFLSGEEALFLVETNKLELRQNNAPLSIQEGFRIIKNFDKYLAYKKLALQGYKVKPMNAEAGPPKKVAKIETEAEESSMEYIFTKLREGGPKSAPPRRNLSRADYSVATPGDKSEFHLVVESNKEYSSAEGGPGNLELRALCSDDDVSFYKFYNTNVPVL